MNVILRMTLVRYRLNPSEENREKLRKAVFTEFKRLALEAGIPFN